MSYWKNYKKAALGSIALDMARSANNETEIEYGRNVRINDIIAR